MKRPRPSFSSAAECLQGESVMTRKLAAALLFVAASGCRLCSDACDYSPPVINGPYAGSVGRAGSVMNPSNLSPPPPPKPVEQRPPQPLIPMPDRP